MKSRLETLLGPIRKRKVRWVVYRLDSPGVITFRSHKKALGKAISMGVGTHIERDVELTFKSGASFSFTTDYNVIKRK
jgi:hypothetical protein